MGFSFALTEATIIPLNLHDLSMGAVVVFEGRVRNHHQGQSVARLEYSAYQELAQKEGERVLKRALDLFPITCAHAIHRTGVLECGEVAVWIAVGAHHRAEAYRASEYIIDNIKQTVPIWKKEHYSDGHTAWPHCEGCQNPAHHHHHHANV